MKLLPWLSAFVGSYIGWAIGRPIDKFVAIILSILGACLSGYYARKWVRETFG